MYMLYIWLGILCIGLLIESLNAGTLVTIWFSAGAIIPLIMSCWGITNPVYITIQIVIFGIVTSLCMIFLRKIAKKMLFKNSKDKTNLDLYVGKKYTITNKYGNVTYIKFNGIEYSAYLENDDEINDLEVGNQVEIIRFEGNKAIVKLIAETNK
ncbi:MAG: NfeD family protein [Clostridia bacterium]|nr:NfeD family protein [Clostridia bacterium]